MPPCWRGRSRNRSRVMVYWTLTCPRFRLPLSCTGVEFRLSHSPLAVSLRLSACLHLSVRLPVCIFLSVCSVYQYQSACLSVCLPLSASLPTRGYKVLTCCILFLYHFHFQFHFFSVQLTIKPTTKCTSSVSDFYFRFLINTIANNDKNNKRGNDSRRWRKYKNGETRKMKSEFKNRKEEEKQQNLPLFLFPPQFIPHFPLFPLPHYFSFFYCRPYSL